MNYKWYSLTPQEIEKILRTNAALGLSKKAAHSRARKTGGNSFFFVESRSIGSCLRYVFCDPLFLLLLGVDAVAAIFGELTVAISVGAILLLNIICSFVLYVKSQWVIESMSAHSHPRVRVIRDGALYLSDARGLVPGDILLLGEGDVIPCDCRVISSNEFKVEVYFGRNESKKIITEPDAMAIYSPDSNLEFYEYRNTIYAGSVVLSGEARVVATEIGEQTYIGAFDGGFSLNKTASKPKLLGNVKKISSIYSFSALIMILILAVIGIFTYGSNRLLSTFMLSLSLGVSLLGEMIFVIENIIYAKSIYTTAAKMGTFDGAVFKSPDKLGTLAKTDRLIMCGTSALTDGMLRVVSVYVDGKELKGKDVVSNKSTRPAELFMLLIDAIAEYPSGSMLSRVDLPRDFIDYAKRLDGFSTGELSVKPGSLNFDQNGTVSADIGAIGNKNIISVSESSSLLKKCNKEMINGQAVLLSTERKSEILKIYEKIIMIGARPYIVTSGNFSGEIFEGIFAMRSVVSNRTIDSVKALQRAGIRLNVFLDKYSPEILAIFKAAGIIEKESEILMASELTQKGIDIVPNIDKYKVFVGASKVDWKRIVLAFKKQGHTVAVCGHSIFDREAFSCADIGITYDRAGFTRSDEVEKLEISEQSGVGNSPDGAQILRLKSDLLIRKASSRGGGISGIFNAISSTRSIQKNFMRSFIYLILSQIVKLSVTVPAFIFGKDLLTSFHLLFCTFIVDFAAVWMFAADRNYRCMDRHAKQGEMKFSFKPIKTQILITAIAAVTMATSAIVVAFVAKVNVSGAVFVTVVLSQILIMLVLRDKKEIITLEFLSVTVAIVFAVLALSVIPKLSIITGTLFSWQSAICIPIAPVMIFFGNLLTRRINSKNHN